MLVMGFTILLTLAMAAVMILDTTRYLIPNSLNLTILIAFGAAAFFLPVHLPMALAAAGLVLLVGLGMFALGLMGGGDIKLLVVLTLWTGWGIASAQFLMLTALMGGVLVIILLPIRALYPQMNPPRILTRKQPVPYGIAIAGAFLLQLWNHGVPPLAH